MQLTRIWPMLRYAARYPKTRYGLLALPLAVAGLLVILLLLWWPVANQHAVLSQSVEQSRRALLSVIRLSEMRNEYRNVLHAVERIEAKLDKVIPLSEFVDRLNGLARQNQVQIVNESRQVGKPHNGYLPIHQELVLEADYAAIRKFLSGLSSLPTWTVVNELRLARQSNSRQLKANLVLVTFQKQSGEQGG